MVLIINLLDFSNFIFMKKLIFLFFFTAYYFGFSQNISINVLSPITSTGSGIFEFNASSVSNNDYVFTSGLYVLEYKVTSPGGVPLANYTTPPLTATSTFYNSTTNTGRIGFCFYGQTSNATLTINCIRLQSSNVITHNFSPAVSFDNFSNNYDPNYFNSSVHLLSNPNPLVCLGQSYSYTVKYDFLVGYPGIYNGVQVNAAGEATHTISASTISSLGVGMHNIANNSIYLNASNCYSYSYTLPTFFVLNIVPTPNITNFSVTSSINCLNSSSLTYTVSSPFLYDGTYTTMAIFFGPSSGTSTGTIVMNGGVGTLTFPNNLSSIGSYPANLQFISNGSCSSTFNPPKYFITDIVAPPNISGVNTLSISEPICLGDNGAASFSSSLLQNGTYNISYNLSGNNSSFIVANNVIVSSGVASFVVPSSALTNGGTTTIELSSIVNISNGCSSVFPPNSAVDSFVVNVYPNITGTNSVFVTEPLCLGSNGTVTFNASALANGTYSIVYALSGSNVSTQTASSVVVSSGTGTFTIPSSALANAGTTTISLTSISNTATACSTAITPGSITDSFVISILPNMTGTNSVAISEPLCLGSNGTVTFNASTLANGTYSIVYNLSGSNVSTQTASSVVVSSGTGTFTIPSSALANAGTTTISLTSISNTATACSTAITPGSITDSFVISILPNVTGTNTVTVVDICIGSGATAIFTSTTLANGTYNIVYGLTGANVSTQTAASVVFTAGTGTFTIPSSALANAGTTNITLTTISNTASSCQSLF